MARSPCNTRAPSAKMVVVRDAIGSTHRAIVSHGAEQQAFGLRRGWEYPNAVSHQKATASLNWPDAPK